MFTGIVEETGRLLDRNENTLVIEGRTVLEDAKIGDSIAVNGCCLTVVTLSENSWTADITEETIRRTGFDTTEVGARLNLERSARMTDRFGGHVVQGHVDAVGEIVVPAPDLRVRLAADLLPYLVVKGSIAVDGVGLTIVNVHGDGFDVALIPHTISVTNLGDRKVGDKVNIEVDIMAKYVERLLSFRTADSLPTV
jgi:riboflavin synthase